MEAEVGKFKRRFKLGDEPKDNKDRKLTLDELKSLINDIVKGYVTNCGYVKLAELKDAAWNELKPLVSQELLPEFEKAIKALANLPGPGGAKDIGRQGRDALKGLAPTGGYDYFAEFAKDVFKAGVQGAQTSPRFIKWLGDINLFIDVQKAAGSPTLEISDPEEGGYLTPPEFASNLLDKGFENSNFIDRCTMVPMAINQIGLPYQKDFDHTTYLHGAMMAYWLDEKTEKQATKPKFGKVTLRLNKLVVLVYATDELLEDSIISMEPLLQGKAGDVLAWKLDQAIFRGTGAGQPQGVLTAPCRVSVPKEAGQAAATIVFNNLTKMYSRCYPQCLKNAVWVANLQIFPQLATVSIPVGTGGAPAYLPANGISGKPFDSLFGKEIAWTEHASALGTLGDIGLVDFTQYLVGQKRGRGAGIQFATSIHLKFDFDQTAFRFVLRMDGQPWWPSVFTPAHGDTQSPVIFLADRI